MTDEELPAMFNDPAGQVVKVAQEVDRIHTRLRAIFPMPSDPDFDVSLQ